MPMTGKEYSEATAARLDEEVKEIVTERAAGVRELLSQYRALLEETAVELLKKEVLDSEEFYRMVEAHRAGGKP